jgi:hypothetical protein
MVNFGEEKACSLARPKNRTTELIDKLGLVIRVSQPKECHKPTTEIVNVSNARVYVVVNCVKGIKSYTAKEYLQSKKSFQAGNYENLH